MKKVYKNISHVVCGKDDNFVEEVCKVINSFQREGCAVEVQYSTVSTGSDYGFSALILCYEEVEE